MAVKVPLVEPAGTETEVGTVRTFVMLLESITVAPPLGAPAERVTVQFVLPIALKVVLAHCKELNTATGLTVRVTVLLTPLRVAVTTGD